MALTLEERARRNAKRLNNKEKKRHPLFADQFATTPEQQAVRLADLDKKTTANLSQEEDRNRKQWEKGDLRRAELVQLITPEQLAECDTKWNRAFGPTGLSPHVWGGYGSEYWLNHWWQCAKQYAPAWAQEHCLNIQFHDWALYQKEGKCPTCYKPLVYTGLPEPVQETLI